MFRRGSSSYPCLHLYSVFFRLPSSSHPLQRPGKECVSVCGYGSLISALISSGCNENTCSDIQGPKLWIMKSCLVFINTDYPKESSTISLRQCKEYSWIDTDNVVKKLNCSNLRSPSMNGDRLRLMRPSCVKQVWHWQRKYPAYMLLICVSIREKQK